MKKSMVFLILFLAFASVATAENPEVFFSPDPKNELVVADFIAQAKSELLIESYSMTNVVIAAVIKIVKERGVKVSMVCDKANAKKDNDFCVRLGGKPDNRSGLMHNKVMIRDGECVLTGSFNFTNNAVRNNRENFLIYCDKETATKYRQQFEAIAGRIENVKNIA